VEIDHHIPRSDRVYQMCHLQEPESERHLIFWCLVYYEIRGRYYCLYRDSGGSLSTFFRYQDHRCLALFIREILNHRSQLLYTPPHPGKTRRITSCFHAFPPDHSNKRQSEFQSTLDHRVVRPWTHSPSSGDRPLCLRLF
jgi:hypothetical protein